MQRRIQQQQQQQSLHVAQTNAYNTTSSSTVAVTNKHHRGTNSYYCTIPKLVSICGGLLLVIGFILVFETAVSKNNNTATLTRRTTKDARNEFYHRYGGEIMAQQIYQRGIQSFGSDSVRHTAHRILSILAESVPKQNKYTNNNNNKMKQFVLSFAGYSVTVGRGNHYHQSYPFVVQRILQSVFATEFAAQGGIDLVVRNSAIGGIPSFPYGFCLSHFLGNDANGISWDYSMNEGKSGSTVLEAYVRQSLNQLSHTHPMMIVLDTNMERCQLIEKYLETNLLYDGICVGMAKDAVPNLKDILLNETIPIGFQQWDEFGASPSCPGRGNWHPKRMEHELIGYMISMYFIDAIEIAKQTIMDHPNDWKTLYATPFGPKSNTDLIHFPPPMTLSSLPENNDIAVTYLLYGHPNTGETEPQQQQYTMHHVSCRTNFLPATDVENVLSSIIVDGLNRETTSDNIMTPRTDTMYENGWTLDVSSVERDTKVKVEQCGGLGYVDMKISLYGTPKSGTLRLWLPIESSTGSIDDTKLGMAATNYYHELVICEANEKRSKGACRLDADVEYIVGGSTKVTPTLIHGAGEYLKRPTCVHIGIPDDAVMTTLSNVQPIHSHSDMVAIQRRLSVTTTTSSTSTKSIQIGLIVDVRAKENVSREKGSCCISHVVWEEKHLV